MTVVDGLRALPSDLRAEPQGARSLVASVLCLGASPLAYLGGDMPVVAALLLFSGLGWLHQADLYLEGEP